MKTTFKVIIAVFALGLIILVLLHVFLQFGLTKVMREVVLPRVKMETGIDARVEGLSINVVQGRLYLKGVAVRNPEGFMLENLAFVEQVNVELDIPSLLKKKLVRVKNITVDKALVNVIRNKDGKLNIEMLQEGLPASPSGEGGEPVPESRKPREQPSDGTPAAEPSKPLPEVLVDALDCRTRVRYLDFKQDQLDIALDLSLIGSNLGTQRDPAAEWGKLALIGSLGDDNTSFVTDLKVDVAPIVDLQSLSFDLNGRIMEINPKIMEDIYDKLGIRSAPFGLDPQLHCRSNRFEDSSISLNLRNVQMEEKLSRKLGGMGSIASLRFPVPVEGTLQDPQVNVQQALLQALGGNAKSLLNAFLKGAAAKEAGVDGQPENLSDAAVDILGEHVEEIGKNESAKKLLKDLADGKSSDTNTASQSASDTAVDILGEQVEEIGENEALKESLKGLGRKLFGN